MQLHGSERKKGNSKLELLYHFTKASNQTVLQINNSVNDYCKIQYVNSSSVMGRDRLDLSNAHFNAHNVGLGFSYVNEPNGVI